MDVQLAEHKIIAALRHRHFFTLAELNQAIHEPVEKLNQRLFVEMRDRPTRTS
jgi:hypothetical protein